MNNKNYCTRTNRLCVGGAFDGGDGYGIDCAYLTPVGCPYLKGNIVEVVVTRHPGLVEVLREQGLVGDCEVISHASPEQVRGRHVAGVLPLALAAECASVTEVALNLPPEARGKELTADEVRQYMAGIRRYRVEVLA